MKYLLILFSIILYKFLLNHHRLNRLDVLENLYEEWCDVLGSGASSKKDYFSIKPEVIDLFLKSGITRPTVSRVIPIGMNHVRKGNPDVWDNMFVNDMEIISLVFNSFDYARSEFLYRKRMSYNLLYWVDSIIFLPRTLMKYLGFESESFFIKIFNVVWWIVGAMYTIYSDKLNIVIQEFLSKLFK